MTAGHVGPGANPQEKAETDDACTVLDQLLTDSGEAERITPMESPPRAPVKTPE